jgi:hypothetical protein
MPTSITRQPLHRTLRTVLCTLALQFITTNAAWAGDTKTCDVAPSHGFNLIQDQQAPFGSAQAWASMKQMRATGANTVAFIPFLWQRQPDSTDIARGSDMSDEQLAQGIRAAHRLGMSAIVKPQVWVPGTWAGAVHMNSDADWNTWFAHYESALLDLASVAQHEHAEGFVVGTELDQTVSRAAWPNLIARIRAVYRGNLTYVAHNVNGAEQVPFWSRLDEIGVTLYPSLVDDNHPDEWARIMQATNVSLRELSQREGRPVVVAEIGLRSATGAAAKPWESAEERKAPSNEKLQADVLRMWLGILSKPPVQTVLVWRWISQPGAGGRNDTDFTVQGKAAEHMLASLWAGCKTSASTPTPTSTAGKNRPAASEATP